MQNVGPRYGVRAYFRDLREKTRNLDRSASADWFERSCAATRRPMTADTIRGMIADHEAVIVEHGGFGFIEKWSTVLGRPSCHSTGYIPVAATIRNHPVDGSACYDEDVVLVRRLDMEVSQNKLTYSMATAHLAIGRHALERLYARAACHQDTFAHTLQDELLRTLCGLSVAVAADLGHAVDARPAAYHHQAVPFGSGLMILDGRLFADWNANGPRRIPLAQHHVIKNGKSVARRPLLSRFNSMTIQHPEHPGESVWASRVFTSRTYLDRDDMSLAKARYCETFNRLLDDYDMQPLLQTYFRPRPYEDRSTIEIDLPDEALNMMADLQDASADIFNVDRALPVCSVRSQDEDSPVSTGNPTKQRHVRSAYETCEIEIVDVAHHAAGTRSYATGHARISGEDPRDASFMVQGGNYKRIRSGLHPGACIAVTVRRTGSASVTIVEDAGTSGPTARMSSRKAA